uniref:DUF7721 domain-containing protein n=1 Tax=Psilocybe cubensis TaxID=181762 RepID=A0A8H7YA85_PSICU
MDTFINLAKQGYSAYQDSQENVSKTGGQDYNSPDNRPSHHRSNDGPNIDEDEAIRTAQEHGSGGSDLFSSALSFISSNKHKHQEPVDEEAVTSAHSKAYGNGDSSGLSAHDLGGAAALQVLKQFTSGSGGGSGSQTQLISLAMAEATKLFDQSGGAASGNKQDAVNSAGLTVMKLLVQSKFSGAVGGSNSGGLSGLMGLAKQFM